MNKWLAIILMISCSTAVAAPQAGFHPGNMNGMGMGMHRSTSNQVPSSMSRYGCSSCHAMDRASSGPAWRWIAWRYKNQPRAIGEVAHFIGHGGSGYWGGQMPNLNVPPQVARQMAEWILSQRAQPPPR